MILADEFFLRKRANPRYSLRAFAKSLGMEHSTISQLLRGTRPATAKSVKRIASALRWTGASVLHAARESPKFDSRRIARSLGISVDEVNLALTDLCMLGLIQLKGEDPSCPTP